MSTIRDRILRANAATSRISGKRENSRLPLGASLSAVLTCMDARIDPARLAGLAEGDAHRHPQCGGCQRRRLPVAGHFTQAARTREWFVIHQPLRHGALFTTR